MPKRQRKTRKPSKLTPQQAHARTVKAWRTKHLRYKYGVDQALKARRAPRARIEIDDDGGENLPPGINIFNSTDAAEQAEMPLDKLDDIEAVISSDPNKNISSVRKQRAETNRADLEALAAEYRAGRVSETKKRKARVEQRTYATEPVQAEDAKDLDKTLLKRISALSGYHIGTDEKKRVDDTLQELTDSRAVDPRKLDAPVDQALRGLEQTKVPLSDEQRDALEKFAAVELAKEISIQTTLQEGLSRTEAGDKSTMDTALEVLIEHAPAAAGKQTKIDADLLESAKKLAGKDATPEEIALEHRKLRLQHLRQPGTSAPIETLLGEQPQMTQDTDFERNVYAIPRLAEGLDSETAAALDAEAALRLTRSKPRTNEERLKDMYKAQREAAKLPLSSQRARMSSDYVKGDAQQVAELSDALISGEKEIRQQIESNGLDYLVGRGLERTSGKKDLTPEQRVQALKQLDRETSQRVLATAKALTGDTSVVSLDTASNDQILDLLSRSDKKVREITDSRDSEAKLPAASRKRIVDTIAPGFIDQLDAMDALRPEEKAYKAALAEKQARTSAQYAVGMTEDLYFAEDPLKTLEAVPAKSTLKLKSGNKDAKEFRKRKDGQWEGPDGVVSATDLAEMSKETQLADGASTLKTGSHAVNEGRAKKLAKAPARFASAQALQTSQNLERGKNLYKKGGIQKGFNLLNAKGDIQPTKSGPAGDIELAPLQKQVVELNKWELANQNLPREEVEKKDKLEIFTDRPLVSKAEANPDTLEVTEKENLKALAQQVGLGEKVGVTEGMKLPDGRYKYIVSLTPDSSFKRITPTQGEALAALLQKTNSDGLTVDLNRIGPEMKPKTLEFHPEDTRSVQVTEGVRDVRIESKLKPGQKATTELGERDKNGDLLPGEADKFILRTRLPGQTKDQVLQFNIQERTDRIGLVPGEKELNAFATLGVKAHKDLIDAQNEYQKRLSDALEEGDPYNLNFEDPFEELAEKYSKPNATDQEKKDKATEFRVIATAVTGTGFYKGRNAIKNKVVKKAFDKLPASARQKMEYVGFQTKDVYAQTAYQNLNRKLYQIAHPVSDPVNPGSSGLNIHSIRNMTPAELREVFTPSVVRYSTKLGDRTKLAAKDTVKRADKTVLLARKLGDIQKAVNKVASGQKPTVKERMTLLGARGVFDEIKQMSSLAGVGDSAFSGFEDTLNAYQKLQKTGVDLTQESVESQSFPWAPLGSGFTMLRGTDSPLVKNNSLINAYEKASSAGAAGVGRDVKFLFDPQGAGLDPNKAPKDIVEGIAQEHSKYKASKTTSIAGKDYVKPVAKGALYGAGALAAAGAGVYAYDKYRASQTGQKNASRSKSPLEKLPETISMPRLSVDVTNKTKIPLNVTTDALDIAGKEIPTGVKPSIKRTKEVRLRNFKDPSGDPVFQKGSQVVGKVSRAPKEARGGSFTNSVLYKKNRKAAVGGSKFVEPAKDLKGRKKLIVAGKETPFYAQIGEKERYDKKKLKTKNPGAMTVEEKEKVALMVARQPEDSPERQRLLTQYGDIDIVSKAINDPLERERLEKKHNRLYAYTAGGDREIVVDDLMEVPPKERERKLREFESLQYAMGKNAYEANVSRKSRRPFGENPYVPGN